DTHPPPVKQQKISLNEAFLSPLEATGISLTGGAFPDRAHPGNSELRVAIDLSNIHLEREKGNWVALLSVATEFPAKKRPNSTLEEIKLTLTDARLKESLASGYVLRRPFAAGNLMGNLRVAIQDRNTGEVGSLTLLLKNQ